MANSKTVQLPKKNLLNVREAAMKLGVTVNTIRKWQHQRRLPFIKLYGAVRFDSSELDHLIQSMTTKIGGY